MDFRQDCIYAPLAARAGVAKIIREVLRAAVSPGDAAPHVMMKIRRRLVAVAAREVKRFIAIAAERPRSR